MATARREHQHHATLGALLVVTVALAGCAGTGPPGGEVASGAYDCMGTPVPAETLTDPRPATELDATGRAALDGREVPPIDPAEWTIVTSGRTEVVLLRQLAEPDDHGAGDVRTHERLTVSLVDADQDPPAWMLTALGSCALTVAGVGAGTATVTLDPADPPSPGATEVALLVTEMACAGGEDAEGRVEVRSLRATGSAVEMVLAVEPRGGDQTCPSNPATPITVDLGEPLGDRVLLDASTVPPRPITMPTG